MATTNKDLAQPVVNSTNWEIPLNANFGVIDEALGGVTSKNVTGVGTTPVVLTTSEYQKMSLTFTGTLSANVTYHIPSGVGGQWIVRNGTSGSFTLTVGSAGGGTSAVIPQGIVRAVYSDGTNIRFSDDLAADVPSGSLAYSNGSQLVGSANLTYDGSVLRAIAEAVAANTVISSASVRRTTSGTAAAGIGAALSFETEVADSTVNTGGVIAAVLTDATVDAETYKLQFRIMAAGAAAATVAEITNTGITYKNDLVLTSRATENTTAQDLDHAGFTATADDDGTQSSGTYTPTPVGGNMKRIVNGGAFTLAAPTATGDYTMVIQITNNASAGAITLSGFSKTSGNPFTTTNGHDFFVYVTKCNGFTLANTVALQ